MSDDKRSGRSDVYPLLLVAGVGAIGTWLWWRQRQPLPPRTTAMSGRVCVVTGANAGIGKATATALAQQGAHVVLACRSLSKGEAACKDIRRKVPGAAVETLPLDLASVESIRGFVKSFRETSLPLHVLINNAGIIPGKPALVRGMEQSMVVNHLGPFLLTNLLLPDLRRSASSSSSSMSSTTSSFAAAAGAGAGAGAERDPTPGTGNTPPASRIINVASKLEKLGRLPAITAEGGGLPPGTRWFEPPPVKHDAFQRYGSSKLCNMLFTLELQRRLSAAASGAAMVTPQAIGGGVMVSAVTPGIVNTALGDGTLSPWAAWAAAPLKWLLMRDVEKGAETVVWAATSREAEQLVAVKGGGEGRVGSEGGGGGGGRGRGLFFGDMKEVPCSDAAKDEALAARLWEASEVASGLEESERKFCDSQVRKVIRTVLTFDPRDSLEWRECAEALIDEACARRYLVGLDWMASRAVMAITKTIRWRLDIGLHRSSIGRGACGQMQDHDFLPMDEDTPIRVSPVKDAEGRPVVIFSAIRWPKDDTEWLRMLIGALEVAAVRLRAERTTPGGGRRPHEGEGRSKSGGDTWLWLVDMEGAGPGNAPSWQTLRNLDGILAAHYPGRLRNVLIVNSSAFLRISMSFMEKLLDEKARAKLVIVDGRTVKLERYISSADPLATLSYRE